MMIRKSRSRLVVVAAIAAACAAAGATAQLPYRVGARATWTEPPDAGTPYCEGRDNNLSRQLRCVVGIMKKSGATASAVEFVRRFSAQLGEICYLSSLQSFGPIALATIVLPFRRNTNAHTDSKYAIVNGEPSFVPTDDDDAVLSVLASNPAYLRLKKRHPNIGLWEGTVFAGEHPLAGGGYRFVFSYPLGEYHAEAGR